MVAGVGIAAILYKGLFQFFPSIFVQAIPEGRVAELVRVFAGAWVQLLKGVKHFDSSPICA